MSTVIRTAEREWKKDDGTTVKVTDVWLDDQTDSVPGYDLPALPEVGKPLPEGWSVETSKSGKPYIKVPKPRGGGGYGGGQAAFRNTKEGQAIEQERMDRRTALMQAVTAFDSDGTDPAVLLIANNFYAWLRETSGGGAERAEASVKAPASTTGGGAAPPAEDTNPPASAPDPRTQAGGECPHTDITLTNPAGAPLPKGYWRCTACGKTGKDA
jgi:hypothetical protein